MAEPNKYEISPQIQQPPYQISGFPKNFLPRFMKREESRLNLELSLQCQMTADEENNVPKLKKVKEYQMVESGKVALDSMPIVITRGKEIQGILYSQNPVKIVCICHAKFFSPDEFVQHAGAGAGGAINPLQYITVLTR